MSAQTVRVEQVRASTALLAERHIEYLKEVGEWSDFMEMDEQCWQARHTETGLTATGDSLDEALENLSRAIRFIEEEPRAIREWFGWT